MTEKKIMPRHIAIIMDGNGRWAKAQSFIRSKGHGRGAEVVREVTTECSRLGVERLTLYAFSTENWKRPKAEVTFLMELLKRFLKRELATMLKNNIRFLPIGRLSEFSKSVQAVINDTIEKTKDNTGMVLSLALNYSGRAELADAMKEIGQRVKSGEIDPDSIDEDLINRHLYAGGALDPDLLIRTADEQRISNFMLWQISYAEFWTTPVLWPDFGVAQLEEAIESFGDRERRYGGVVPC